MAKKLSRRPWSVVVDPLFSELFRRPESVPVGLPVPPPVGSFHPAGHMVVLAFMVDWSAVVSLHALVCPPIAEHQLYKYP